MRVEAARVGLMMDSGPISQPTRQPVAAKASGRKYEHHDWQETVLFGLTSS